MNARLYAVGLVVAQMLLAAWPASSAPWGSVGMVVTIRNAASVDDVKVERSGEGRRAISPHDPLYNGDHLVIRRGATACVNLSGVRSCWNSRTKNTTVRSQGPSVASIRDAAFFRAIGLGPPAAGLGIATGTVLRSAAPATLAAIGLLPPGTQFVTPKTRIVVAGWRGPARTLTITADDGRVTAIIAAPPQGFAEIPLPGGDFHVQLDNSEVAWSVKTAATAPTPPWYAGRQPVGAAQRLAQATWIVTEGPVAWRMYALGELAALANDGDDSAAELYRAALEGRLQPRRAAYGP